MKNKIFPFVLTVALSCTLALGASASDTAESAQAPPLCHLPDWVTSSYAGRPCDDFQNLCTGFDGFQDCGQNAPSQPNPAPGPSPDLPEAPSDTPADSSVQEMERQVAQLTNQQRTAYGLAPLTLDASLCAGARLKAQDMHDNHYFSHTSPTYGSAFDQMQAMGITYRSAGENIAQGYSSAEAVVQAWMASPSHKANILSDSYTTIGVGYCQDGGYWVQWFLS